MQRKIKGGRKKSETMAALKAEERAEQRAIASQRATSEQQAVGKARWVAEKTAGTLLLVHSSG